MRSKRLPFGLNAQSRARLVAGLTVLAVLFNLAFVNLTPVLAADHVIEEDKQQVSQPTQVIDEIDDSEQEQQKTEEPQLLDPVEEVQPLVEEPQQKQIQQVIEPQFEIPDIDLPDCLPLEIPEELQEIFHQCLSIRELVAQDSNLSLLDAVLSMLEQDEGCSVVYDLSDYYTTMTLFAPDDAAIQAIVREDSSQPELDELYDHQDELCQLVSHHIVSGEEVNPMSNGSTMYETADFDGTVTVTKNGSSLTVDQAGVTSSDDTADNGILHTLNDVLLPNQAGQINQILTDYTSPALSGTIDESQITNYEGPSDYCVLVRIDGVPYAAEVDGTNWTIPAGVVELDPLKSSTLFDVIVRIADPETGCATSESEVEIFAAIASLQQVTAQQTSTSGEQLVGLTMKRGVIQYQSTVTPQPPSDNGQVLGTSTDDEEPVVLSYASGKGCGKGLCSQVAQNTNPAEIDSDGDGVPDSQDPAPNDSNITGQESDNAGDQENSADSDVDQTDTDNGINPLLWILAGLAIGTVGYVLWQRGGTGKDS